MMFVDQLCHLSGDPKRSISPLMGFESLTGLTLQVEPLAQFSKSNQYICLKGLVVKFNI